MMSIVKHTEVEKRLTINRLPVPDEVVMLINDYLYHTKNTSPIMRKMREARNKIGDLITNYSSVKMNQEIEAGEEIEEENWWFRISIPTTHISLARIASPLLDDIDDYWPLSIEYDFGGKNCKACGEYKRINWYWSEVTRGISSQNTCKCLK